MESATDTEVLVMHAGAFALTVMAQELVNVPRHLMQYCPAKRAAGQLVVAADGALPQKEELPAGVSDLTRRCR